MAIFYFQNVAVLSSEIKFGQTVIEILQVPPSWILKWRNFIG